jgi:hypothetical protein
MSNDNSRESNESKVNIPMKEPPSSPPPKRFRCLICSKDFKSEEELMDHKSNLHGS